MKKMNNPSQKGGAMKTIVTLLALILLGSLAFYFLKNSFKGKSPEAKTQLVQKSQTNEPVKNETKSTSSTEKPANTIEKNQDETGQVEGEVISVEEHKIHIRDLANQDDVTILNINAKTPVSKNNEKATLADVAIGSKALIKFKNDSLDVVSITLK